MRIHNPSPLPPDHPDKPIISRIENELTKRAGGFHSLRQDLPGLIRQSIDEVIDTTRTGRVHARELEKTEKTYIGTKIEILVRNYFRLPKGILDLKIDGFDVDVKNTLQNNWMIPREAVGMPCILIASDEDRQVCFFGIFIAHTSNLTPGLNQDQKRSVSSFGFKNIHWMLNDEPYPPSFWSTIGTENTRSIMRGLTGNERIAALFRLAQGHLIHRDIIQAVAQQKDYMKRLRKNGGARDILAHEGIAILSGKYDHEIISKLGLGNVSPDEFISYKPERSDHIFLLKSLDKIT